MISRTSAEINGDVTSSGRRGGGRLGGPKYSVLAHGLEALCGENGIKICAEIKT